MTDGNNEKPQTDAQASRALAQQLGKLAALVLLVIVALLIKRYCSHKPPPFGPGVKIVSIGQRRQIRQDGFGCSRRLA